MLVSAAITDAYREGNLTALGDTPKTAEFTEGLSILNRFWTWLRGHQLGEAFQDWQYPPPANQVTVPETLILQSDPALGPYQNLPNQNSRVLATVTAPAIFYFPQNPSDGARMAWVDIGSSAVQVTLNGNGRLIEGNLTLVVTSATQLNGLSWFYRADLASWQRLPTAAGFALTDNLPLPPEYDDLFVIYLSLRLQPRNAQEANAITTELYKQLMARLRAQYRQYVPTGVADSRIANSVQAYGDNIDALLP